MKKLLQIMSILLLVWSSSMTFGQYLDSTFRAGGPNPGDVAERLYGNGNSYTTLWDNPTWCTGMLEVTIANWTNLNTYTFNNNTVYILDDGNYNLSAGIWIYWQCIALVWKWNAKLHTDVQTAEVVNLRGSATGIILDGFTIDWDDNAHTYDTYGLKLVTSAGPVSNNAFNNLTIRNTEYAVEIFGQSAWNPANNNIFTNNTFIDNTYGVSIVEPTGTPGTTNGTTLSGNEFIGNGTAIINSGTSTTNTGNLFSGNTTVGESGTNATGSNFPTTYLTDEQQCNNFGGCYCTPQADAIIADTTRCTDTTKTTRTTEGSAYDCNDHDGCTCSFDSNNYAYGSTNISCTDGTPTTLSNGQTCTDPDGCSCNGAEIAKNAICRIATSGGGGGGGSSPSRNNCSNRDYSSSYYDGTCGVAPSGDLTLGGVVDDDAFGSYSVADKAQLLAGEYKALVDAGETTLRHGEFFTILFKYAKAKNISAAKLKITVTVLRDIFADMSEAQLAKFGFDKTVLLQELKRLIA